MLATVGLTQHKENIISSLEIMEQKMNCPLRGRLHFLSAGRPLQLVLTKGISSKNTFSRNCRRSDTI